MAWVAVDNNGAEYIYVVKPSRERDFFASDSGYDEILLPKGSIRKLIGRDLTWEDEPVELKEE